MMYLIRGLPGVGKSTLARKLAPNVVEADQFFMTDGVYRFDGSRAFIAHRWCEDKVQRLVSDGKDVVVANTFVTRRSMQPYLEMGAPVTVITVDNRWTDEELAARSAHNVPVGTIEAMRKAWEA